MSREKTEKFIIRYKAVGEVDRQPFGSYMGEDE